MDIYDETKFILNKYHLFANKKLGQNFLVDDEAIEKIVEAAEVSKNDLIIEIGPGLGTLTKLMLERAGKVIAIELDERMVEVLNDRFIAYNNFELINEDVLKVNLKELIKNEKKEEIKVAKVVANLPYYITTPIIMKLLEDKLDIESITVMIQKEVADRLVTKPGTGDTGAITHSINYYTVPERVIEVPNTSFVPAPEVNSTVIKLNLLDKPAVEVENEELLFKVIKVAFMQKRKTLLNSLSNSKLFGTKQEVEEMLNKLNIDINKRAEKLRLEDFANIANYLSCQFK